MFTFIALALALTGLWCGPDSHTWAVAVCTLWGALLSFSVAPLVDSTVYERMRRKHDWSLAVFHGGNLALHVTPVILTLYVIPMNMALLHGVVAAGLHAAWGVYVGGPTLRLDDVYVPLCDWSVPWTTAWVGELGTSLILQR